MVDGAAKSDTRLPVSLAGMSESMRTALAARHPTQALDLMAASVAGAGPWDSAAIAVLGPKATIHPAAFSDQLARNDQACQQVLGEGPTWQAAVEQSLLTVDDVATDPRWPLWASAATGWGIASTVAVPLFTGGPLGVLTFHRRNPGSWHCDDLRWADIVGAHVSVVVANARMQRNLWGAIGGRTVIGQAQGMLMERYRLDPDGAFALLRKYSQLQNIKLAAVAQHLVTTGTLGTATADAAGTTGVPAGM